MSEYTSHWTSFSVTTDRSIDNLIGAEVYVSKRDRVALKRLRVIQVSISASNILT